MVANQKTRNHLICYKLMIYKYDACTRTGRNIYTSNQHTNISNFKGLDFYHKRDIEKQEERKKKGIRKIERNKIMKT